MPSISLTLSLRGQLLSSGAGAYAINNFSPEVVADFVTEYYRTSSLSTTFADMFTYTGASNKTMVDSDGLLKWTPHNILNDTGAWSTWTAVRTTKSVSAGVLTLTQLTGQTNGGGVLTSSTVLDGWQVSYEVKATANGKNFIRMITNFGTFRDTFFNVATGVVGRVGTDHTASISGPDADGFYLCKVVVAVSSPTNDDFGVYVADADNSSTVTDSGGVLLKEPRAYRSDLGGMVNNPDTGDSYVPTSSAAVYMPRRGNHVYDGSAWVNEGLLLESEARTNLITYSSEFDNTYWNKSSVTVSANIENAPSGAATADKITATSGTAQHRLIGTAITLASGAACTYSLYLKAGTHTFAQIHDGSSISYFANFDISTGTIGTATGCTAAMQYAGDGWYRCSIAMTLNAANPILCVGMISSSSAARNESWAAVGTETIFAYGAQVEAGSTPSSYIPTSGATATRAAETLTIAAAKMAWPEPVVIGSELVTNGAFDSDVSGWTDISSPGGSFAWNAGGYIDLICSTGTVRAKQAPAVTPGSVFKVTVDVLSVGGSTSTGIYFDGSATPTINFATAGVGTHTAYYVAPDTVLDVEIKNFTLGTTVSVDNISVQQINPLSVSMQMDGTMTYADTNVGSEAVYYRWQSGAGDFIKPYIDTTAIDGFTVFNQQASGVFDFLSTRYPGPGINVPFNIASRHGSTFINGAVGGVALTADTTPVALPDLSATNFSLGYDFMGNIGQFRQWAADLGDTGIVEASA